MVWREDSKAVRPRFQQDWPVLNVQAVLSGLDLPQTFLLGRPTRFGAQAHSMEEETEVEREPAASQGRDRVPANLLCPLPRRLATSPSALTSLSTLGPCCPGHALHLNQESGGTRPQLGPLRSTWQGDPGLAHPPPFLPLLSLQSAL